jgi:hypothetical protein
MSDLSDASDGSDESGFVRVGKKPSLDNRPKIVLTFCAKFILLFLKTRLKRRQFRFWSGSVDNFFTTVPLGRFYSSRPSLRMLGEIVSE